MTSRTRTPKQAKPRNALWKVLRNLVDRQPVWFTPYQWSDEDGLYANDTEAWLFRRIPPTAVRDTAQLQALLNTVVQTCGPRDVQLTMHTWEHQRPVNTAIPGALAQFQHDAIQSLVPTRVGAIGVRLTRPPAGGTFASGLRESVDQVLAEQVPDLTSYDQDRASVTEALNQAGATALTREQRHYLESWYTLGVGSNIEATERDEMVFLSSGDVLEFSAAETLDGKTLEHGQLPSGGQHGSTVLSVRGRLTTPSHGDGNSVLMKASVIYARRTDRPEVPLSVALLDLPAVTPRPLPLRQLAALHETLPCSPRRLTPVHQKVDAAQLAAFGFADPRAPGVESGLLVGTGGQGLARLVHLNPFTANRCTALVGATGSGKTFLSEVLAYQGQLGGFRVLYLTAQPDAGMGLVHLAGAPTWTPDGTGQLDPLRWLPQQVALTMHHHLLMHSPGELSADERNGLNSGFARAAQVGVDTLGTVMQLADGTSGIAKVMRSLHRRPATRVVVQDTPGNPLELPPLLRVDLSALVQDSSALAVASGTLLSHSAATSTEPTLVVLDGLGDALPHAPVQHALTAVASSEHCAVVVTATSSTQLRGPLKDAAHRFVLSTVDHDAVAWVGREPSEHLDQWLADALPTVEGNVVQLPSAGLYLSAGGTPTSVQFGPWPDSAAAALTRGRAEGFRRA